MEAPRESVRNHGEFIWSIADLLRGDYKRADYGKVILPLVVIRRLDCVLEPTKQAVLARKKQIEGTIQNLEPILRAAAGQEFYNTSPLTFTKLLDDPNNLADNLNLYIGSFSPNAKDVIDKFEFVVEIGRLDRANLLFLVMSRFANIDLHPDKVSNIEMGAIYEELIRRFAEQSNETAGEHFTPRDVIRLMVNLLFIEDDDLLAKPGVVKSLYDPACGTGGMLSVAEDALRRLNPSAELKVFGQELNAETYAVCRSDMMLTGKSSENIHFGNSFTEDGELGSKFDYMLANPPFGVEWTKVADPIRAEAATKGLAGRFGAGLPRINDGSFLFLQHMLSKVKPPEEGGTRLAIVFNGSPLFTGGAGSGESEIRRWIIENDWLEAVVALPDQLFYNTGISTYFWVLTNRKSPERRGKVQLLDAREMFVKMRKSLGDKRKEISPAQIEEITRLYGDFAENEWVKVFTNEAFGYLRITVERPLRLRWEVSQDALAAVELLKPVLKLNPASREELIASLRERLGDHAATAREMSRILPPGLPGPVEKAVMEVLAVRDPEAQLAAGQNGSPKPDPELRDGENVPLPSGTISFVAEPIERLNSLEFLSAIRDFVDVEVRPYLPDAWVDLEKTRIGYEIPLARHFYRYRPPRPIEVIDAELRDLEGQVQRLLAEVTE